MKIRDYVLALTVCFSLSGCGLVQQSQLNKQYKEQQREKILSRPGVQALSYILKDDKIVASEGGSSLCPGGCSLQNVVDKANRTADGITMFYIAIHDYSGDPPSLYKIENPSIRYTNLAGVLNNFSMVFGSSLLSEPGHVSTLYRDFTKEREVFGLNYISEKDFVKAASDLYKERDNLVIKLSSMRDQSRGKAAEIKREKAIAYDKAHPEMAVTGLGDVFSSSKAPALRAAFNQMPFVTRTPKTNDSQPVYANVGGYNLTLNRVIISVQEQLVDCQRITAYSGYDIEKACFNQVGNGLSNFAEMIKNKSIHDLTKTSALGEATFGNVIDFDHAARLANMHTKLCKQQGNQGYVAMVTVAAPCSGRGDVLNIYAAKKMGVL